MDVPDMAPPSKRRKLSTSISQDMLQLDHSTASSEALLPFPQTHKSAHTLSSLAPSRTVSTEDSAYQPNIYPAAVGGIEYFKVVVARQATIPTTSSTSPALSSPVITDATSLSSPTIPFPSISSPTLPADTVPAGVSSTSSVTPTTTSSAVLDASDTITSASTTSGALSTPSIYNGSSTALTSVATPSSQTAGSSGTAINSTSIASTTATSGSTFVPSTLLRGNDTKPFSSTDVAFIFLATLTNGDVKTISRHREVYTTTLSDGELFTIPPISTTLTRPTSHINTAATLSSSTSSISPSTTAAATASVIDGGGVGSSAYSSPPTSTAAVTNGGNQSQNNSAPPAGTIAGGVVGGAAGLAVLLLIAMLFLRWYRRKSVGQHRALPPGSMDPLEQDPFSNPSGPGMAERAGIMPFMSAVPGLFRHQNRSLADSSEPSERGFTRVSGRKLPSAFSEGMSSETVAGQQQQPIMPMTGAGAEIESNSSYRDSYGRGGTVSPGSPTSPSSQSQRSSAPIRTSVQEMLTMSAGPQRQPQVHSGGPYTIAPGGDLVTGSLSTGTATFARSDTPASLRNSRFTEDMA